MKRCTRGIKSEQYALKHTAWDFISNSQHTDVCTLVCEKSPSSFGHVVVLLLESSKAKEPKGTLIIWFSTGCNLMA